MQLKVNFVVDEERGEDPAVIRPLSTSGHTVGRQRLAGD